MENIKIVLDCYGCDKPAEVIKGGAKAIREVDGVSLILTGNRKEIESVLKDEDFDKSRMEIVNAEEVIVNGESPTLAIRTKKDSSLVAGFNRLKDDPSVKAIISAGSTGAVLCGAVMLLGRCEGVKRPALASVLPTDNGGYFCLADCGANVDCKSENLLDFARFASEYMKRAFGISSPRVGLLSVGTEEGKGNALTKEAYALLKDSGLNFVGNIEAKSVTSGEIDALVCDGFDGNIILKNIEGTAKSVIARFIRLLMRSIPEGTDPKFIQNALGELMKIIDFNAQGSAILLGVRKIVLKAHGSAVADTVVNTVKQAAKMIDGGFDKFLAQGE